MDERTGPLDADELEALRVEIANGVNSSMDRFDTRMLETIAARDKYITEMEATHIRDHDHIGRLLEEQRADRKRIVELEADNGRLSMLVADLEAQGSS